MIRGDVINSGVGISEKVRDRLFESFITTKEHGMGIGLAISRAISEALGGGELWSESNPSGGRVHSFSLPLGGEVADE